MPIMNALQRLMGAGNPAVPQAPAKRLPPGPEPGVVGGIVAPPPVEINDPSGHLTGKYDRNLLQNITNEAKLSGMNPLTALAMAGQESTFGKQSSENPLQVDMKLHETPLGPIHAAMRYAKQQLARYPEDEELGIQAYNGLGRIQGGSEIAAGTPMYDGQTALNGRTDRPYGKAVMRLREMLASQPQIQGLLKR